MPLLNALWAGMILAGIAWAAARGEAGAATRALFAEAVAGFEAGISLTALIALWFGLSRIAERAGLLQGLAWLLQPLLRPLFPGLPRGAPPFRPMSFNLIANLLGLANAATPFGLETMRELRRAEPEGEEPGEWTVTFLAINSACVTLVPATAIALRAAAGSPSPGAIVAPAAFASGCALLAVLVVDRLGRRARASRHSPRRR